MFSNYGHWDYVYSSYRTLLCLSLVHSVVVCQSESPNNLVHTVMRHHMHQHHQMDQIVKVEQD
jgi:hypothetical protein